MPHNRHDTYLNDLPPDWELVSIEQLGALQAGGTPSRMQPTFWNGPIPWVTPGELTVLRSKWLTETRETISQSGLASSAAKLLPKDSMLVTTRATIGAVALAAMPVATNQGFKSIVPNGSTDPHFYYHLLRRIAPEMVRLASGSTFDEISRRDFAAIVVPRPPLPEQRRIAEILDTVDTAIQQTEALIAKLKQMKAGLLHELLTRGLDEHGQLRDPDAHPEQFMDSPLGRIPREWEVLSVFDIVHKIKRGPSLATNADGIGVRYLTSDNITESGELDWSVRKHLDLAPELLGSLVRPGDVIVNCVNSVGRIGKVGFIEALPEITTVGFNNFALSIDNNHLVSQFAFYLLGHSRFQQQISNTVKPAINQVSFSARDLGELLIVKPSIKEQYRICDVVNAHNNRIRAEEAYHDKLKQMKKGLMDDLLTGRVRVNVEAGILA